MFNLLFFGIFLWGIYQANAHGGRLGLQRVWIVGMLLMPCWMINEVAALQLDLRTGAALAALIGLIVWQPREGIIARLTLVDVAMGALLVTILASQWSCGQFGPLTIPEFSRKWLLPYLMGRLFLSSTDDLNRVLPSLSWCCLALSIFAVVEAVTKINPVNLALGKTFSLLEEGEGYRMGLKRAQGLVTHPIYFGLVLVLMLPWTVIASRRAQDGQGPKWWRFLPWIMGAALFATVSRGPQLAGLFTAAMVFYFRRPKLRLPLIVLGIVAGVAVLLGKDLMMDLLGKWAGEKEDEEPRIILINDEEVEYTGTKHRILLYDVYGEGLDRAGWFGYGYQRLGVPIDETLEDRFGSIDCHYIRFILQHGYLGLSLFIIVGGLALINLGKAAWNPALPQADLAGGLFGAMAALFVILFSVWFSPDFGSVWLFVAGLASTLHLLRTSAPLEQTTNETTETKALQTKPAPWQPRLVPGYAPLRHAELGVPHDVRPDQQPENVLHYPRQG